MSAAIEQGLELIPDIGRVGPIFDEPWQAQAFSVLVALHRDGRFEWQDWVDAFSRTIKAAPAQPGETANAAYFRQWAGALESFLVSRGLLSPHEILGREEEWRQAYLNTPHGEPVELANARCPPRQGTHLSVRGRPVAVSAAQAAESSPAH